MNIHLKVLDKCINRFINWCGQGIVKYNKIDRDKSGAIDKSLKSQKIVNNLKLWKVYKGYWFGKTFIKASILCQLGTKNLSFY